MNVGKPALQRRWTSQMYGLLDWLWTAAARAGIMAIVKTLAMRQLIYSGFFFVFLRVFLGGDSTGHLLKSANNPLNLYSTNIVETEMQGTNPKIFTQLPPMMDGS